MNINENIVDVFQRVFNGINRVELQDLEFNDSVWDSLKHVQLILELEAKFDISLDLEEVIGIRKLQDALKIVEKKIVNNNSDPIAIKQNSDVGVYVAGESVTLATSFECFPLAKALESYAKKIGAEIQVSTLPFGTLQQYIRTASLVNSDKEIFIIFPWDILPELDWRTGIPEKCESLQTLKNKAETNIKILKGRKSFALFYVAAPTPPIFYSDSIRRSLDCFLDMQMSEAGAHFLSPQYFSLPSYLYSGFPFVGGVLEKICQQLLFEGRQSFERICKVLVTDLDNVLWQGVISEDGMDGIEYQSNGAGWPSYIYQSLLRRLKNQGILIAAVSRNRMQEAMLPLESGRMLLSSDDFVSIKASYGYKSSHIRELSEELSIGLDSFVFVDDNIVELEEVSKSIPELQVLEFPKALLDFQSFLWKLSRFFDREILTTEDHLRTELYKKRSKVVIPACESLIDISDFLRTLEMGLKIKDITNGSKERAIQLINKTNQFNINSIRRDFNEVDVMISRGGRLFTAELCDKYGEHGEVVACLIGADGVVENFVMSCRVLQRRVEFAFILELINRGVNISKFHYVQTERNMPATSFINNIAQYLPLTITSPSILKIREDNGVGPHLFRIS